MNTYSVLSSALPVSMKMIKWFCLPLHGSMKIVSCLIFVLKVETKLVSGEDTPDLNWLELC